MHEIGHVAKPGALLVVNLDIATVSRSLGVIHARTYYNFPVTRILPDSSDLLARLDRLLPIALRLLSPFLGGRVMVCGTLRK